MGSNLSRSTSNGHYIKGGKTQRVWRPRGEVNLAPLYPHQLWTAPERPLCPPGSWMATWIASSILCWPVGMR